MSPEKTCSSVTSRSVARTRIVSSPALSNTFDSIGTVECAFTILLAAPTAPAMSLVLHVNFIDPPWSHHRLVVKGIYLKKIVAVVVIRCNLRRNEQTAPARGEARRKLCSSSVLTCTHFHTACRARRLSTLVEPPCAVPFHKGVRIAFQSAWQRASKDRTLLRYASSTVIWFLTLSRAYITVV